jgi:hypothetical protein
MDSELKRGGGEDKEECIDWHWVPDRQDVAQIVAQRCLTTAGW